MPVLDFKEIPEAHKATGFQDTFELFARYFLSLIPTVFIKWMISIINQLHSGTIYSDEAFDQLKEFFLNIYPFACRHLTDRENERVQSLMMMPGFLGWALG